MGTSRARGQEGDIAPPPASEAEQPGVHVVPGAARLSRRSASCKPGPLPAPLLPPLKAVLEVHRGAGHVPL